MDRSSTGSPSIDEVAPPEPGVYRLAWRPGYVFAPPPWHVANAIDGTFDNRFDDPSFEDGIGPDERFRMVHCATERRCTLMESTARFRRSVSTLAKLKDDIVDSDEGAEMSTSGSFDPDHSRRGILRASWRFEHQIGYTHLSASLRFADIAATRTLNHLRHALADVVLELGLSDIDLSVVTGPNRKLTSASLATSTIRSTMKGDHVSRESAISHITVTTRSVGRSSTRG